MKQLVLTLIIVSFTVSAAAVVGGPNPSDGQMGITSTSSAATTSVGPNGTEYKTYFSVTNVTQSNQTGVTNYSWTNDTVSIEGIIQTPTPCHDVQHNVEKNGNVFDFDITSSRPSNTTCAEVVSYQEYEANFTADQAYILNVTHDGEEMSVLEHPKLEEDPDQGFLSLFLKALIAFLQ